MTRRHRTHRDQHDCRRDHQTLGTTGMSVARRLQAHLHAAVIATLATHRTGRDDRGQATTEYALVLLGAALVALLLVAWASSGGSAGRIGRLFDRVIDSIIQKL